MAGALFAEIQVPLFVAGVLFCEVQLPLFAAGALFGEVQLSLFVAGAIFAEVQLSLFVAGAVFGEIWNDNRSAKCCIFQYKTRMVSAKIADSRVHGRIMLASWSDRPRIVNDVSAVFSKSLSHFGCSFFVAGTVFG